MSVLLSYEESQTVCKAFRAKGIEAFSNDIIDCSGGFPEWHIKDDALNILPFHNGLKISFPPCTDLAVSGARWFELKRKNGSQRKSIILFLNTWKHSNCVENPIGIMNNGQYVKKWFPDLFLYAEHILFPWKPTQIIQPWQFGHGETKATCLWLKGLPLLTPTSIVSGREQKVWKMPPSIDRAKLRSKTFKGIAEAMATQWGNGFITQSELF